jgi:hypothetical protein
MDHILFVSSLVFSEISEGRWVKCFQKFLKGGGLNQNLPCSHIQSGFRDSVKDAILLCFFNRA